ncbi:MAG TPA: hypothetical protein VMT53_11620 [Terriglobales bacterium]|nr:hypothetical protein [Terriglobales bacterium]
MLNPWLELVRSRKLLLTMLVVAAGVGVAAKDFSRPRANPAVSYPAHDEHKDEGVTVAVDPYDMPDKTRIFNTNYAANDLLPIFLVVTNDGNEPVSLNDLKAELVTVNRSKIEASSQEDVFRRLSHPDASAAPKYPLPLPRGKVKPAVNQKTRDEVEAAEFNARAVEPHSTQSGFLFFDVGGISNPLAGAHFYLTGLRNGKGDELMYFEIPMEKYLSAPSKPQ